MNVKKNKVVTIEYTLTDDKGAILDTSKGREPLSYIQGMGNIIVGLEEALEGKKAGDEIKVVVEPAKGYGLRDDALVHVINRSQFPGISDIQPGMQFQAEGPEGAQIVTVTAVQGDEVTVDANHPLAGQHLTFEVAVVGVRKATSEELAHRHAHGPGGHQH